MTTSKKTRVLIVGGGFGGIRAALELRKCPDIQLTILSDNDHFRYYPGLYHTATGGWSAGAHIPLTDILDDMDNFVHDTAVKLDRNKKEIVTKSGKKLPFDKLIISIGNITNYFGIEGLPEYSYGIKSNEAAEAFKKHLHQYIADNGRLDDNYFVIGGGPTGIELAGNLQYYLKKVAEGHDVPADINVSLIEAMPNLLPRSPEDVGKKLVKRLQKMGIKVYLNTAVKKQTADTLVFGEHEMPSKTVVWTAGVTNHPFYKENDFKLTERGKVDVNEYLETEPGIYVLGDNANTQFSGMAQTALHDGSFVAKNIVAELKGEEPKKYHAAKPVSVVPAGPYWAIVEWGKLRFTGLIGWGLRVAADLIGFHDIQTWPKACAQLVKALSVDELKCPDCGVVKRKAKAAPEKTAPQKTIKKVIGPAKSKKAKAKRS